MRNLVMALILTYPAYPEPIPTNIDTTEGPKPIVLQRLDPDVQFPLTADPAPELDYSKGVSDFNLLVPSVPVLDQGNQGTCVTFATIAAVDATLSLGDVVSQQCLLELKVALKEDLWDGAWKSAQVIDPLKQYGAVRQGNCGSSHYPDRHASITVEGYKALVDLGIAVSRVQYVYKEPMSLEYVENAIKNRHYVSIGFGLLNDGSTQSVQGFDLTINGSKHSGGLWACKQPGDSKNYCSKMQAGHEVVVIGYDDTQQLLKIQNSWNTTSGNAGFYYMSYEFYKAMEINATEIWSN